ncbi:MAG: hypothetical protein UR69_C0003G0121 [Candidatus Moranbacteria bacterium GW2011_GWE2_35_2-]|nr:MAG: hypothetical protein UR69_C0003G0121 [Candidatus Moranbacteria bacterium GW2011_GWE2_35_2-]KKQ29108.1 MAG: hypothetical protein US44_C0003G0020 [Candidatus Moranbacteria bacterium GW2011_GWD1_37_17]KKQ31093.1 MAG: hypothetical protein US47_C0001G0326 [Candidatus Moranbacteria bacterium GW2011_GWE1_37_24]KKQ46890.1 MAG: hypothetical protein US66_C0025G0013 [Candidatus Moranbacteria bacterium GW2011_GWD2_37_9]
MPTSVLKKINIIPRPWNYVGLQKNKKPRRNFFFCCIVIQVSLNSNLQKEISGGVGVASIFIAHLSNLIFRGFSEVSGKPPPLSVSGTFLHTPE